MESTKLHNLNYYVNSTNSFAKSAFTTRRPKLGRYSLWQVAGVI